jgi:rod shape-determining protein MreD
VTLMQATRPLDPWRWLGWPAMMSLIATLLFSMPVRVFGLALPQPVFPMALAFAWAIIRPSLLAPFILLLLGLCLDAFWGGRMGLWALSLLAPYAVLLMARGEMTGQSRPMRVFWFVLATVMALGTGYLLAAMTTLTFPSLVAVLWQFVATIVLYPFTERLIERFEDADVRFR